jgi:hypothetical protein
MKIRSNDRALCAPNNNFLFRFDSFVNVNFNGYTIYKRNGLNGYNEYEYYSWPGQSQSIVINQLVNNILLNNNQIKYKKINLYIYFRNWRMPRWPSPPHINYIHSVSIFLRYCCLQFCGVTSGGAPTRRIYSRFFYCVY